MFKRIELDRSFAIKTISINNNIILGSIYNKFKKNNLYIAYLGVDKERKNCEDKTISDRYVITPNNLIPDGYYEFITYFLDAELCICKNKELGHWTSLSEIFILNKIYKEEMMKRYKNKLSSFIEIKSGLIFNEYQLISCHTKEEAEK